MTKTNAIGLLFSRRPFSLPRELAGHVHSSISLGLHAAFRKVQWFGAHILRTIWAANPSVPPALFVFFILRTIFFSEEQP